MQMDSAPVNWEALDALVIDFAKSERLIHDSSPPPPSPVSSSSYRWRLLICQIRRSIESGDIDSAIDLLQAYAPAVLDDHRLLFRLQKQKFIELLRKGTADDRDSAIACARKSLAPRALDAYPEAYEEFKHALLAFIYDKEDQMSPVANEWAERRRFEIAGLLSSILRDHLQAYDPIFSLTLRYLISIHKGFCLHQGVPSPIANLTERLLLEERDPPATPQESLFEAPPFDEVQHLESWFIQTRVPYWPLQAAASQKFIACLRNYVSIFGLTYVWFTHQVDIQALAHAVEITRQGAIESLRFAKGDIYKAFQNELCRMKIDISVLDELVHEYCVYRGIVDPGPTTSGLHVTYGIENEDKWEASSSLSENCSIITDSDMSVSSAPMEVTQINMDSASTQNSEMEVRYPCEMNSLSEDCSTSRVCYPGDNITLQRNRSLGSGDRGKCKRWRGRDECLGVASEDFIESCRKNGLGSTALLGCTNMDLEKSMVQDASNRIDKFEIILGVKKLASSGMAAEVVEEINGLDPDFFTQNPTLLFQLKQVEFFKLVGMGDHSGALKVASSHLGPLAGKYPALLKPLRETLFALLRSSEEPSGKHLPLGALATSLQVAIGRRFGIEEPQLMKIIKATLHTHTEWFKLQMCKDQFDGLLWINSLKEHGGPLLGDAASKSTTETCTQGSSPVTITSSNTRVQEDGSSSNHISSSDTGCDENAILKVMEFLALPRGDAIHLLAQYNGNAETVIQQIFA